MAKGKTYELALKIAGRVDSSLKKACLDAAENLGKLAKTAEKIGKAAKVGPRANGRRGPPRWAWPPLSPTQSMSRP